MTIAGHSFPSDDPDAACSCGMTWASIAETTASQIGEEGIAHVGRLNSVEFEQIVAERTRRALRADAIWDAVRGVAAL